MQNKRQNFKKTLFAKKSFGQNFLIDEFYISKIINALAPQADQTIIEIGAGRGALTAKLLNSGANVVAIELEREMISVLKREFAAKENFQLVESDALKVDFSRFKTENQRPKVKLVANLPYYISTAILQKLIEEREVFSEMILMFQKEVVERITAKVGDSERGFLTVLVENYLEAEKLFDVPSRAFRPAPKVNSSIVRLISKENVEIPAESFRNLISLAFRQKRKTLYNNLKNEFPNIQNSLEKCGIEANVRAESLTMEEWRKLSFAILPRP